MKTIKIILFSAFLLGTIQSKAAFVSNNDELVLKMVDNEQVNQLLKNTYKIALIASVDSKLSDKECREIFFDLCSKIKINKESVENTFPAYSAMNTDDKNEILKQVAMKSEMFSAFTDCLWKSVAKFGVCVGGVVGTWGWWRFCFCAGVAGVADLAAVAATDGAALPAAVPAAVTEIEVCAAATIARVTVAAQIVCAGQLGREINSCPI